MRHLRYYFVMAAIWGSFAGPLDTTANEANVTQRILGSVQRFNDVEIRANISGSISSSLNQPVRGTLPTPQVTSVGRLLLRSNSNRALVSWKEEEKSSRGPVRTQIDGILYKNGDVLHCQAALDPNLVQVKGVNDDLGFTLYSKRIAGTQEIDRQRMLGRIGDIALVYGYLGNVPIANYLNESARVTIDRSSRYPTVASTSAFGRLKMTVDPVYDYLPNAFTLTRRGTDLYNGQRVDQIDMKGGNGIWPRGGVESIIWEAKDIRLDLNQDAPYVKGARVVQRWNCADGVTVTITSNVSVEDIRFSPNLADESFNTDIIAPAGYDVTVRGASHLPYEWDGFKPVPRAVRRDTILTQISEKGRAYTLLFIGNILLLVVLAVLLLRKYVFQQ